MSTPETISKPHQKNKTKHELNAWNILKKKLETEQDELNRYPRVGEVWVCAVGKNLGFEQNGSGTNFSRPTLVVKKFNNHMFWTIPLSTRQKQFDFFYNFTDPKGEKVSAIIAQLKLMSIKRFERMIYEIPLLNMKEIMERLRSLLV